MENLWDDLDLELISRIKKLELNAGWNLIVQSMTVNYLFSIRKAIEEGLKDKEILKNSIKSDNKQENLNESTKEFIESYKDLS